MKKNESEIEEIVKKALDVDHVCIEKHKHYVVQGTDFYQRNDNIYDSSEYWTEEIAFPQEAVEHEKQTVLTEFPKLDDGDADVQAWDQLFGSLEYWTVYYKPDTENIEAALKSGLTPFHYKEDFYLALGGCGMDLSPKLEAYEMLVAGTVPDGSHALRYPDYFANVVGQATADEAFAACTRETPRVIISYDEPKDDYK